MAAPKSYNSTEFLESAGTVLLNPRTKEICILCLKSRPTPEYVLPKGRRNIKENRQDTAIRETKEETGYACHLLPITVDSWQPREDDDGGYIREPLRHENVTEPFMVVHRMLEKHGVLKIVWWYLAAVDEHAGSGPAEKQFERRWVGFERAQQLLSFESDREVVARAAEIVETTFEKRSWEALRLH